MTSWRRLRLPLLAGLPVFVILLGLGTWQWQRLQWKTTLLAELAAAEAGPARPLDDAAPVPWTKVFAEGRFRHDREAMLGLEVRGGVLGAQLMTPLERQGAAPLLVLRGWVPLEGARPIERPDGPQRVEGYLRPGEQAGGMSARDDTAGRRFYTLDPAAIGPAVGQPGLAPFALVALGQAPAGRLPQPALHLPQPANNHLGYVITWYGLALAELGVFVTFARRRLKEPDDEPGL
jgi:surfeit locus 1 family protein